FFEYELEVTQERIKAILETNAKKAAHPQLVGLETDPAVVTFARYLQLQAPWVVSVPFAPALARCIEGSPAISRARISRDFQKLLALVKAAAVIRHSHRERGEDGGVVADLADYRTVWELLAPTYSGSLGLSDGARLVVETVQTLHDATASPD